MTTTARPNSGRHKARFHPVRTGASRIMTMFAALAIALTALVAVPAPAAQAAVIGDNYPAYLANATQDALVDPWRFYNRECTSFVAWRLNNTNGVPFTNQYLGADLWWGNANTWGTSARAKGILVDKTPAVGSVAWSTAGKYGHVAWVAEVLDGGKIVVEEYNWGVNSLGEKGRYRARTTLASSFTGFIHIKDLKSWPPSDGAFINVKETGEVYRIAGGAPLYVSDWAVFGGPQYTQTVTKAKFDTLPKVPKNGTYIRGQSSGNVYSIAHGAPIHVASWDGVGGEQPTIGVDDAAIRNAGAGGVWRFLRAVPSDGFIRGSESYRIFRLVAGRPYYVTSWAPYGGERPYVTVDDASINSCNHMVCDPVGDVEWVSGDRGSLTVAGWAQDPNTTSPVSIHVYVDGQMAGSASTSRARADIEKKYHRGTTYGYKRTLTVSPGTHEVCAYAINAGAGTNNTHLGCKTVTAKPLGTFVSQPTPAISGILRVNETLTATVGTWNPKGSVSLQWRANGVSIPGATGKTLKLTSGLIGKKITVLAKAKLTGYTTASQSSRTSVAVAPLAAFSAAPSPKISGTQRVGSKLTATVGTWKPGATSSSFSWLRDGKAISGATSKTYTLRAADMGKTITFSVKAAARGYVTTTKSSSGTAKIRGLTFTKAPQPSVLGTVAVGQVLTATAGAWSPAPDAHGYQWMRNGSAIANAKSSAYTVTASDVGAVLSVVVTGTKSGYVSATTASAGTAKVPVARFAATTKPTIAGTPQVGKTLTASVTGWSPSDATMGYKWKRNGTAIDGATNKTYVLTAADLGASLTVVATGTKPGYTSMAHISSSTAKVRAATLTATPNPTITGTAKVGQTLTAKTGSWAPAPVTLAFQWSRNGKPVANATKSTYVITSADKGAAVSVVVTGTKAAYTSVAKVSASVTPK
jgi:surface antigen